MLETLGILKLRRGFYYDIIEYNIFSQEFIIFSKVKLLRRLFCLMWKMKGVNCERFHSGKVFHFTNAFVTKNFRQIKGVNKTNILVLCKLLIHSFHVDMPSHYENSLIRFK